MSGSQFAEARAPSIKGAVGTSAGVEWLTRALFGIVLAVLALGATIRGGLVFVAFVSLGCALAIREWHRLFAKRHFHMPALLTIVSMIGALFCQLYEWHLALPVYTPVAILALGSLCNLLLAISRGQNGAAHAVGAFYIGFPALSLLVVRQSPAHAIWLVVLVLLAIWATDTGALLSGQLIGGPKLAPRLSPKKTWAGSVGGLVCAALVSAGIAAFLHAPLGAAVAFGLVLSFAGQLGDLFESSVKRRTGCKDSGGLIPGHGGFLDRIDSILFAAPAAAAMLFVGFDPLVGAHA